MGTMIVIPARMGSSRFPGKPMAMIAGRSMIERMWRIATAVEGIDGVVIAIDDPALGEHVRGFGGHTVMTDPACRNGTERVNDAIRNLAASPRSVINLQGDAVLTPPWIIQAVADRLAADRTAEIVTPAVRLTREGYERLKASKAGGEVGGTTVTFDAEGRALYFSKTIIPFIRGEIPDPPQVWRHIGLYGYRRTTLAAYLSLPVGQFERVEQLEQLRALEAGIPITVVETDYRGRSHWAVDAPSDVAIVEEIIAREGELVP